MHSIKSVLMIVIFIATRFSVCCQDNPNDLERYIAGHNKSIPQKTQEFYTCFGFKTAWIGPANQKNLEILAGEISRSTLSGLVTTDYDHNFLIQAKTISLDDINDSFALELKITGIAMDFYHDMMFGDQEPAFSYKGLSIKMEDHDVAVQLSNYLEWHRLGMLAADLNKRLPELQVILKKLASLYKEANAPGFDDVTVSEKKNTIDNSALTRRLVQTAVMEIPAKNDEELKKAIRESQKEYGLLSDGVIRSTYLAALNIPLKSRIHSLILSLNYYRWLAALQFCQTAVVVNIPAAYLKVYEYCSVSLEMRIVTGKPSTPTPTLTSTINEVVLYPYWHVPYKIATKELLPLIKRNRAFLDEGNYQVLNRTGKVVDPASVNWQALNAGNFPFTIRQSTGCDNALGILKLNFYNPYDVYLHDTPNKSSFMLGRRYLSHGCMRIEKPFDLARVLLPVNHIAVDTLDEQGNLRNKAPVFVKADTPTPLVVWYNPVGTDNMGQLVYYEDVYEKFKSQ